MKTKVSNSEENWEELKLYLEENKELLNISDEQLKEYEQKYNSKSIIKILKHIIQWLMTVGDPIWNKTLSTILTNIFSIDCSKGG